MNQSKELTPVSTSSICIKTFLLYVKLSEGFSSNLVSRFVALDPVPSRPESSHIPAVLSSELTLSKTFPWRPQYWARIDRILMLRCQDRALAFIDSSIENM